MNVHPSRRAPTQVPPVVAAGQSVPAVVDMAAARARARARAADSMDLGGELPGQRRGMLKRADRA